MPTLAELSASPIYHGLHMGQSGGGKTGALAALANAGFRLHIADFDVGYAPLLSYVKPEAKARVEVAQFRNKLKQVGKNLRSDGQPNALHRFTEWMDKESASWTSNDILVLDSLSFMGEASLRYTIFMNGAEDAGFISQPIWGDAMKFIEMILSKVTQPSNKFHVIANTHVEYQEADSPDKATIGLPMALGSKLPRKVGTFFNTTLYFRTYGTGAAAERRIYLSPTDGVGTKLALPPGMTPPSYLPIDSGLTTVFGYLGIAPQAAQERSVTAKSA